MDPSYFGQFRDQAEVAEIDRVDAKARFEKLNPVRFKYNEGIDIYEDGFIAHELQEIVPHAVMGKKDAVDDEGNPLYQQINKAEIVPLMTVVLQDAMKEVKLLREKLRSLEQL
jgi:hypothetical protein